MLRTGLKRRTVKRKLATEPLVDHYSQRILVAGMKWVSPNLLRCCELRGTSHHLPGI